MHLHNDIFVLFNFNGHNGVVVTFNFSKIFIFYGLVFNCYENARLRSNVVLTQAISLTRALSGETSASRSTR